MKNFYSLNIAGVKRNLPYLEIKPGVKISILNILGDTELVQAAAHALADKLVPYAIDYLLTAEAKSIPLAYALSVIMQKPYIVLRKSYKTYMGLALKAETLSITTGAKQILYLDEKDCLQIQHKNIAIIDDVISTGSTLRGMREIIRLACAHIVAEAAICTEGDAEQWKNIIALAHLPIIVENK